MYNNYLRNCYFYPIIWGWETLVIHNNMTFVFICVKKNKTCVFVSFVQFVVVLTSSFVFIKWPISVHPC